MTVEHVEVLVEELSTEAALQILLPRILDQVSFAIHVFQGKSNLIKRLPSRLKGYSAWLPSTWRVVVLVDRDDDDCRELKSRLEDMARTAGLSTRTSACSGSFALVNRLAVEELEAWYFGDWHAVRAAYPRASPSTPRSARYRDPDAVAGGTWEAFERILKKAGYFENGLRKIEAARKIAPFMDLHRNRSRSFQLLVSTLEEIRRHE